MLKPEDVHLDASHPRRIAGVDEARVGVDEARRWLVDLRVEPFIPSRGESLEKTPCVDGTAVRCDRLLSRLFPPCYIVKLAVSSTWMMIYNWNGSNDKKIATVASSVCIKWASAKGMEHWTLSLLVAFSTCVTGSTGHPMANTGTAPGPGAD